MKAYRQEYRVHKKGPDEAKIKVSSCRVFALQMKFIFQVYVQVKLFIIAL
jgi:hypothetical protein